MVQLNVILVGAGGIGAHAAQALHRQGHWVVAIDGDVVSESNLDRQLFIEDDLGLLKVFVLASKGWLNRSVHQYLTHDRELWQTACSYAHVDQPYVLFGAVDNMAARRTILAMGDWLHGQGKKVTVILCGNEENDAEAIAYAPGLTLKHPYQLVPEMETSDDGHDPLRSCTAGPAAPQTYLANLTAAVIGLQLMKLWAIDLPRALPCLTETEQETLIRRSAQRIVYQKGLFLHTPEKETVSYGLPT